MENFSDNIRKSSRNFDGTGAKYLPHFGPKKNTWYRCPHLNNAIIHRISALIGCPAWVLWLATLHQCSDWPTCISALICRPASVLRLAALHQCSLTLNSDPHWPCYQSGPPAESSWILVPGPVPRPEPGAGPDWFCHSRQVPAVEPDFLLPPLASDSVGWLSWTARRQDPSSPGEDQRNNQSTPVYTSLSQQNLHITRYKKSILESFLFVGINVRGWPNFHWFMGT